jgi:hypothetical protein
MGKEVAGGTKKYFKIHESTNNQSLWDEVK